MKTKIIFVCLGNICRSPLAEALFKHKLEEKGLGDQFEVASCGTANYHVGDPPDERTIRNAKKNGVVINHVGRQLAQKDLEYFDHIIPMDSSNYQNIFALKNASIYSKKITMMRDFEPGGKGKDVPDPWYGQEPQFQEVFEILDKATKGFLDHLINANL